MSGRPHILYLHGFRSSPRSYKARVVHERMARAGRAHELICPQLPASPQAAMALVLTLAGRHAARGPDGLAIIGSSLGGFYATWLAERFGCRAALVNPAVDPLANLEKHVGVTTAWHSDEPFEFKREYIDELAALKVDSITQPERYFLLARARWLAHAPLCGRAPACDRGRRPCGVGLRAVCGRGVGVLRRAVGRIGRGVLRTLR
jgi:predicted esterase YcpF (UPF0227 family)